MKPLVDVVLELKRLLVDPRANFGAIVGLLAQHSTRAEYEVARFLVTSVMRGETEARLRDVDPVVRRQAIQAVGLVFARAPAAAVLRRAVKDPVPSVRAEAVRQVKSLRLADVAPPDVRYRPRTTKRPWNRGAWNPSGWLFGLSGERASSRTMPAVPPLRDRAALASLLGLKTEDLRRFMRAGVGPGSGYVEFERPKRTGGVRRIAAPRAPLRAVQRRILSLILEKVDPQPQAHGFVKRRSIVSNATGHVGAALVAKIDLEDFFPTIHFRRVQGLFTSLGYSWDVAHALAGLTTYRPLLPSGAVAWPGVVPQGAPTSPAIANLICRRLDRRLSALAKRYGATYTRYADDLTFSFRELPQNVGRVLWWVNAICQQEGFFEHGKKRRLMRSSNRQRVTGLVVNEKVAIARDDRRRFKAILHNCKKHGVQSQARGRPNFRSWLTGYAAFVHMVQPELGKRWLEEIERLPD